MRTRTTLFLLAAALVFLNSNTAGAARYSDVTLENQALDGDNELSGTIHIKGRVTVPEGSSLVIRPGTQMIFVFTDTDNDGIGESELLSQGRVTAKGTAQQPVRFHSDRHVPGAWLGLSVMNVETENVFEHALFEDGYMALHAHFSTMLVRNCAFRNNLRGFQSQEGTITLSSNVFSGNNTGVQFRNSKALFEKNEVRDNYGGLNFLYSTVTIRDCTVAGNHLFGVKIRFSKATVSNLTVTGSLQNFYARKSELYLDHVFSGGALLRGFSFENSFVDLTNSVATDSFLDAVSLDDTRFYSDNLTLQHSGRYHLYLKGTSVLSGSFTPDRKKAVIFREAQ